MPILRRAFGVFTTLTLAASLTAAPTSAGGPSHDITITFVRHGESQGNVGGSIDTSVPGPPLTPKGEQQAKDVAAQLAGTPHDGVYASSLVRTQRTAQYLADARFDDAVNTIYRSGDQQPVAYSHGAAIAMWTLLNAKNAPPELLETQPIPNTGQVVVRGNPDDGWTLLSWNGMPFG